MLTFNTNEAGLIETQLAQLADYHARLRTIAAAADYQAPESSLVLPSDAALHKAVREVAGRLASDRLKAVVVVGIGGSNLGTKAVYDAVFGSFDFFQSTRFPKLIFAETTDPEWLVRASEYLAGLAPDEAVVVVVSKSGTTTETIANFEILTAGRSFPIVAVTDEGSALWQAATAKHWPVLAIPQPVGGRFSVLSAVGLLPLVLAGVDVAALAAGAQELRDESLAGPVTASGPAQSAALLALHYTAGQAIYDTFLFHPELESIGKWYRQLLGESIGKPTNRAGEQVLIGITPTVSIGSTDLHSVGQLYLGGPRDKYTTFVSAEASSAVAVPPARQLPELVAMIAGRTASEIMAAILAGTQTAYRTAGLPYNSIVLTNCGPAALGALLQFKMLEIMYLGELFNVNAFDQPSVESYKAVTRQLLERPAA